MPMGENQLWHIRVLKNDKNLASHRRQQSRFAVYISMHEFIYVFTHSMM